MRRRASSALFALCLLAVAGAAAASAAADQVSEETATGAATAAPAAEPPPCSTPDHRRFDFWVGTWKVVNQAREGAPPGTNRITLDQDGCVLREEYTNGHFSGTSLSYWDPGAGLWRQTWIDNQGQPLHLAGGWQDGALVMSGPPGGPPADRVTWTPGPGGTVRQLWEKSADGGATWQVAFDGLYTRIGGGSEGSV